MEKVWTRSFAPTKLNPKVPDYELQAANSGGHHSVIRPPLGEELHSLFS